VNELRSFAIICNADQCKIMGDQDFNGSKGPNIGTNTQQLDQLNKGEKF